MSTSSRRRSSRNHSTSLPPTPPLTEQGPNSSSSSSRTSSSRPQTLQSRQLRVPPAGDEGESHFDFYVAHLYGTLPKDTPFWRNMTVLCEDRRGAGPMTVRYASKGKGRLLRDADSQDSARDAIWSKVREIVPNGSAQDVLPTVVFSETSKGQFVDLVFKDCAAGADALHAFHQQVDELKISTQKEGETTWHTLEYVCVSNSLDGAILPFEIHGLPIDHIDAKSLFDGVTSMASPIGTVLGIGKVVMTSQQWDLVGQFSGVVRAYCKLSTKSMRLPWRTLAQSLPTRFKWDGVTYALTHPGEDRHRHDVVSIDYCPTRQEDQDDGDDDGEVEDGLDEDAPTELDTPEPEASAASSSASAAKRRRVSRR